MKHIHKFHILALFFIAFFVALGSYLHFSKLQPHAYAQAIVDNQSSSNGSSTWQHTVTNTTNRMLVVTATESVSAVTYNGVALTQLSSQTNGASASASIWYLKTPPAGTYNIVITGGTNAGAVSLSNVDLANPFGVVARAINVGYLDIAGGTYVINELCRTNDVRQICIDVLHVYTQVATASTAATMTRGAAQALIWQRAPNEPYGSSVTTYSGTGVSGYTPMSWTLNGLGEGLFGWIGLSVPINPVPLVPTATPTLTPTPIPPPPPPPLAGGDITNLNFGIANFYPWVQATCGNYRIDTGINNPVPLTALGGAYMIRQSADCTSPGILQGGAGPVTLAHGQASSTNWVVGTPSYPEVYSSEPLVLSYAYLTAKAQRVGTPMVDLSTVCTLSNCVLPNNLPSGTYHTTGNVIMRQFSVLPNRNYVFLIGGNLTVQGDIMVPLVSQSGLAFVTNGNIVVDASIGVAPNSTATSMEGYYIAGGSFTLNTAGVCNDLRLNIAGAIIANANRSGGSFQNNRDTCIAELTYPTVSVTQRVDLLLRPPAILMEQTISSNEVAP